LELQKHGLLEDGRLVMVEEQLLIFLDIVFHKNSMRQTAVKFQRGLYTINRSVLFYHHSMIAILLIRLLMEILLTSTGGAFFLIPTLGPIQSHHMLASTIHFR
jgi:hypothetical protein